ncbi:MAG: DUF1501 domain-containing protein [Candidatus Dormibacteria bacterium]
MPVTRRDFLAASLASFASGVVVPPAFAKGVFAATTDGTHNDRVLVVLQMAGGNDGLNTVVPYGDPAYLAARASIGVKPEDVLHLDGQVGLNSALGGIKSLFDAGQVAVVRGVGYDNPTYSHFENLYVWEYADPARQQTDGWLGKLLAAQLDSQGHPLTACALGESSTPSEMRDPTATVSVIPSVDAYRVRGGAAAEATAPALYQHTPGIYGALFDTALGTAESGIATLSRGSSSYTPAVPYGVKGAAATPNSLGSALQLTAQMIATEPSVKLCHVVLGGWDTHQDQVARQTALLTELDAAVTAFMKDLAAHNQQDRVVLMTWSEFGRRITENASGGTDHGAAGPMFIIGAPVRGGLVGEQPSLTSTIDGGNLKYTVDFRSVYQSLIRDWLQGDPSAVLTASYPELPLIRTA